ncbi:uncharacterized protein G2W53_028368 [Senna tora]|uniref:Uncharacterized protein n=1 Tax=Senna tora TaxID=362788 RepID=A0A834WEQ0_9FABA|nr:uncharacterized protein G2W53_028368 [Senna tora]
MEFGAALLRSFIATVLLILSSLP